MFKKNYLSACILMFYFSVLHGISLSDDLSLDDLSLEEQLINKAPALWQTYFDYSTKLEGSVIFQQLDKNGTITSEQEIIIINRFPSFSIEMPGKKQERTVKGYNPEYYFQIKECNSDSWEVLEVSRYENHNINLAGFKYSMPFQVEQDVKDRGLDFLSSRLVGGVELTPLESLPLLFSLSEFKLLSIDYKMINEEKYVEITYEFEPPQDKYPIVIGSGKFILYPETWLIKSGEFYRANTNNGIIYFVENEYNFDNPTMPIISKRTKKSFSGNVFRTHEETTYFLHETKDTSIKQIYLSHYGLPEPDFGGHRQNRIRYIFIGIGLLILSIGAWRMIQKRRENV